MEDNIMTNQNTNKLVLNVVEKLNEFREKYTPTDQDDLSVLTFGDYIAGWSNMDDSNGVYRIRKTNEEQSLIVNFSYKIDENYLQEVSDSLDNILKNMRDSSINKDAQTLYEPEGLEEFEISRSMANEIEETFFALDDPEGYEVKKPQKKIVH